MNVSVLSNTIGRQMNLSSQDCAMLSVGGIFHDIGKINIPSAILNKPAALTQEERNVIEQHTNYGYQMLLANPDSVHKAIADVALNHHECWDGSGYQRKYKGHIPFMARIVAVADVYDALVSDRPYRKGWDAKKAISYMQDNAGKLFEEEIVAALCRAVC